MVRIDPRLTANFDFVLLFSTLLIGFIGIMSIGSASWDQSGSFPWNNLAQHQMYWMLIGLLFAIVVALIDYELFGRMAPLLFFLAILMLIAVLFLGTPPRRWLKLGPLPAFQPSEFAKIALILILSRYFAGLRQDVIYIKDMIIPGILTGIVFLLIMKEPDLGTAMSLFPIFLAIAFVAGFKLKTILALGSSAGLLGLFLAPSVLKPYQLARLKGFLNPEGDPLKSGYHLIQSKLAIGSGQMWGNHFFQGKLARLDFLPASHTDFIFSVLAEDWGFVGASIILALFLIILIRGMRIARRSKDTLGALIATGIIVSIAAHAFINIGMAVGILPVTGLPLPLMSYGGSAILATFIQIGLLLNIGMRRFTFL